MKAARAMRAVSFYAELLLFVSLSDFAVVRLAPELPL
jgi:hypothetical protein